MAEVVVTVVYDAMNYDELDMLALKVGESCVAKSAKLVLSYMASKSLQQGHLVLLLDSY